MQCNILPEHLIDYSMQRASADGAPGSDAIFPLLALFLFCILIFIMDNDIHLVNFFSVTLN